MSLDSTDLEASRSLHVSSLRESKHEMNSSPLRVGDHVQRESSSATASPFFSPAAAVPPFDFIVDGSSLFTRCAAVSPGKRLANTNGNGNNDQSSCLQTRKHSDRNRNSFMCDRNVGAGANRHDGRPPIPSANSLSGMLPSAAAFPFSMRGVRCSTPLSTTGVAAATPHPASAGVLSSSSSSLNKCSYAATPPSASHATPRFNNYVIGQSATTVFRRNSATVRTAAAAPPQMNQRPPRVPAAASTLLHTASGSQKASPMMPYASTDADSVSVRSGDKRAPLLSKQGGCKAARQKEVKAELADLAEGASTLSSTAAAAQQPSARFAPALTRPLRRRLRLHPPNDAGTSVGTTTAMATAIPEDTSSASHFGNRFSEKPNDHNNVSVKTTAAVDTTRRSSTPFLHMTRTSALRRPVLLTKEASVAAAAAASSSRRSTPRASPDDAPLEKQPELPLAARPADLYDRRVPSSPSPSLSISPAAAAAERFLPYAPTPPRPSSSQPRRSRRTSLASMASNSFTTLQQPHRSVDKKLAATHHLCQSMTSITDVEVNKADSCKVNIVGDGASAPISPMNRQGRTTAKDDAESLLALEKKASSASISSLLHSNNNKDQPQRRSSRNVPSMSDTLPSVVERLRERGNQYMMREEFAQAIATYSEGIRLAPSYDVLWTNRAAAFLLTFRYLPAVADCLYVLSLKPESAKTYWRAAKAYAAAYRFLDAKKYFLLAQQACMTEQSQPSAVTSEAFVLSNCGSTSAGKPRASSAGRQDKAARERQAIAAEEAAVEMVEQYWQHMRAERWSEAVAVVDNILATTHYTGPTAVSWQALRLEALLQMQPKAVLAEAEDLHRKFPEALELYYVLAKALFYTVHDAASTKRSLQLLDEASVKRSTQNTMMNVHVRYAVMQLRENLAGEGGNTAAVQLEAWARRNQLREDSRAAELRHTIDKFARLRDKGNRAYEKGNWDVAAAAYTQCLQTDRLNRALLGAVYCNRTAVYMQAGRWREALSDADAAIQFSPQLAMAYGRRGRIQVHLLLREYEAQRAMLARYFSMQWSTAVKEQLMRYADAAVADLTRAVELSPTADLKEQLQHALTQRRAMKAVLNGSHPGSAKYGGAAASSHTAFQHNGDSSNGNGSAYHRAYANARPASTTSPYGVLQQQLQLLGVQTSAITAGMLPDFKVVAKAYRESALRWHPDKWVSSTPKEQQEAERQFKLISLAYTALRERYSDASLPS